MLDPFKSIPGSFVAAIAETLAKDAYFPEGEYFVHRRSLNGTDPHNSIGVFSVNWRPDNESFEMRGAGAPHEQTISRYLVRVQGLVKMADEAQALAHFSVMAKKIRVILARDPDLRVSLAALQETIVSSRERFSRMTLAGQDYVGTNLNFSFMHLSTTDLLFETSTTYTG